MHVEDDAFSENDTVIDEDPPNAMWKPDGAEATAPKVSEEYRMWRMVANNRRGEAYMGGGREPEGSSRRKPGLAGLTPSLRRF